MWPVFKMSFFRVGLSRPLSALGFSGHTSENCSVGRNADAVSQFIRTQLNQEPMFRSRRSNSENNPTASKLEVKARNIANDAEKAVLVGLIPLLGLVYILRIVQWYLLRPNVESDQTIDKNVQYRFMNSKTRLWVAVLLWPAIIVIVCAAYLITA